MLLSILPLLLAAAGCSKHDSTVAPAPEPELTFERSDWLTVTPQRGRSGKQTLQLTASENNGTKPRKAAVEVTCGTRKQRLTVTQSGSGNPTEPTSVLDPEFARVLEARKYIPDAKQIREEDLAEITTLDISGSESEPGTLTSLRGIGLFKSPESLNCSYNRLEELQIAAPSGAATERPSPPTSGRRSSAPAIHRPTPSSPGVAAEFSPQPGKRNFSASVPACSEKIAIFVTQNNKPHPMKKSCVLVSGGAGYIGSHTTVELINAGYDVVIVDNLSNSDMKAVEGVRQITGVDIPFVKVDCCDLEGFRKVFEQYEFDSVIHFAASKAVGESVQKPLEYYRNNLTSFMNVITLMREFGRQNIVFSSSCTVYGEPEKQPVTEQTPRKPATSPYGNTKQMCEDILRDSVTAYAGLKGIALRYFNPIGAHPSALIGELPRGVPQNLVPYITQTAAGIRECLSVFGDDYPTPDGSCIRDYIDVVDLAKAHVAAIRRMIEDKNKETYEIFNIGTGRGVSVLELVHKFEEVNHLKLNYKIAPRREGDIIAIWADPTLANTELGWKAERTLDQTLASAWAWEKHLRGMK